MEFCIVSGLSGAGKSRVGEATAKSLGWRFVDTDRFVEERAGKTIPEIFAQDGEAEFRRMEREAIEELSTRSYHVIALGGGALTQPTVAETIKRTGILVRLNASVDVLSERIGRKDNRPLMAGLDDEQRKAIHLSAVYVSNFTNVMLGIGDKLLKNNGLTLDLMKPLVMEMIQKSFEISPEKALTGPARRGDFATIEEHVKMLSDNSQEQGIYKMLTNYILENYQKNEKL